MGTPACNRSILGYLTDTESSWRVSKRASGTDPLFSSLFVHHGALFNSHLQQRNTEGAQLKMGTIIRSSKRPNRSCTERYLVAVTQSLSAQSSKPTAARFPSIQCAIPQRSLELGASPTSVLSVLYQSLEREKDSLPMSIGGRSIGCPADLSHAGC